jgi:hypothetical protein
MNKFILKFSIIYFFTLMHSSVFANNFIKNTEFEFGLGFSQSMYTLDSKAHSILKWRDVNAIELMLGAKYKVNEKVKLGISLEGGKIFSGEMTDDDLENIIEPEQSGIFSRTKEMKGNTFKTDLIASYNAYQNSSFKLNPILGIRYQVLEYKPYGVYQIGHMRGVDDNGNPQISTWVVSVDQESQHMKDTSFGPVLGIEFERERSDSYFSATLKFFIPVDKQTKLSEWGPGKSGRFEGTFGETYGIDLKLKTGMPLNEKLWLNFYTGVEYAKQIDSEEYITLDYVESRTGRMRYSEYYKFSIGTSISIK